MLKERLEKVMADKKKVAIGVLSAISVVSLFGNANYVTNIRKLKTDLDTKEKEVVELSTPNEGLYISNDMWREMFDFSSDAVLMVLASNYYDENDYIRDYESFKEFVKTKEEER